jgi:hypothetical protein
MPRCCVGIDSGKETGVFGGACIADSFGCSNWNPFENFEKPQIAANLRVLAHLPQASQASDVNSIPIARSNKSNNLTTALGRCGCSIWLQLKVLCDLFNENLAVAPNESIEASRTRLLQR